MFDATYLTKARRTIREHGWVVQGFAPCADHLGVDSRANRLAYTAGLTLIGRPEFAIVGLDVYTMTTILNNAGRAVRSKPVDDGDTMTDIGSVPFQVRAVPNGTAKLARTLYGPRNVNLLKLVWPDKEGNYPGDPGWRMGDYQDLPD